MESLEKLNLDINSMLINWGLMTGRYINGVINTSKTGIFNMAFAFTIFLFQSIKFAVLIYYPEDSQPSIYLGDLTPYFGPKVFTHFFASAESVNSVILILYFYFGLKKMLFWLDHMQFDSESRQFYKLDLSVSDCKRFTNNFALLWFIIKRVNYLMMLLSFCAFSGSLMLFKHDHYLYYIISIIIFCIGLSFMINH